MTQNYETLPENLPIPEDDGACDHLVGMSLCEFYLPSTGGDLINLSKLKGKVVIYCYPMTGKPGVPLPEGWDQIPGARGCTPQSCSFREHYAELQSLGAGVFGLSTQDTEYQKEMAERLHIPFKVLSDSSLFFSNSLHLPTFEVEGKTLIKRVTIISNEGVIEAVHYPIFPSHSDASWVIDVLQNEVS